MCLPVPVAYTKDRDGGEPSWQKILKVWQDTDIYFIKLAVSEDDYTIKYHIKNKNRKMCIVWYIMCK